MKLKREFYSLKNSQNVQLITQILSFSSINSDFKTPKIPYFLSFSFSKSQSTFESQVQCPEPRIYIKHTNFLRTTSKKTSSNTFEQKQNP